MKFLCQCKDPQPKLHQNSGLFLTRFDLGRNKVLDQQVVQSSKVIFLVTSAAEIEEGFLPTSFLCIKPQFGFH